MVEKNIDAPRPKERRKSAGQREDTAVKLLFHTVEYYFFSRAHGRPDYVIVDSTYYSILEFTAKLTLSQQTTIVFNSIL